MAELNGEFRGKAEPTNVLSWPAFPDEVPVPSGDAGRGAALPRRHRPRLRDLRPRGRGGGDPPRRPRRASRGARRPAPPRPRPRARRRGRDDGGDRDESACQHGRGEPIFALGAPLGRGCGRETWARHPTGKRGHPPHCPKTPTLTVPPGRSSPASSAATSSDDELTRGRRVGRPHARGRGLSLRNLRRLRVDDVSVPRADIVAIPEDAPLAEVVAVFQESELSRLPVYSETLDQPLGLVHLKDLALKHGFGAPGAAVRPQGPDPPAALRPAVDADLGAAAEDAGRAQPHGARHRRVRRRRRPRHHRERARADRRRHRRRARRGREPALDRGGARRSTSPRRAWTSTASRRPPACAWRRPSSPRRSTPSAASSSASPAGCRRAARWCRTPRATSSRWWTPTRAGSTACACACAAAEPAAPAESR